MAVVASMERIFQVDQPGFVVHFVFNLLHDFPLLLCNAFPLVKLGVSTLVQGMGELGEHQRLEPTMCGIQAELTASW